MKFWLLLVEEALLSTGCLKLRATCLGFSSFSLAQSHRNSHPASKSPSDLVCKGLSKKL